MNGKVACDPTLHTGRLAVGSSAVCGSAYSRSPTLCGRECERGWRVRRGREIVDHRLLSEDNYNSINGSYHTVLFQIETFKCICVYFVAIYEG